MPLPAEIPLFPLDVVLFPGMLLPLHIFEPRYRRMLNVCLDKQQPFGMVLAAEPAPHLIGTAAHVQEVERLPDGRSNIMVAGKERFRVTGFRYDQPYLVGQVEEYPLPVGDAVAVGRRAAIVRHGVQTYLAALEAAIGQQLNLQELPEGPEALAYLVAVALQVDLDVKQTLLEALTLAELLDVERRLLQTETAILRYMQRARPLADAAGAATPN